MRTKLREGMVVKHPKLGQGQEMVITSVWEKQPRINEYNRQESYENTFIAKPLNEDGTYNTDADDFKFWTCFVYSGTIPEDEIEIVREMKKIFV